MPHGALRRLIRRLIGLPGIAAFGLPARRGNGGAIGTVASCGRITAHLVPPPSVGALASRKSYRMRRSSAATGKGCALSECRKTDKMWKMTFQPPEGRLPLYSLQPAGLVMAVKSAAAEREMSQAAVVREALQSWLAEQQTVAA